MWLTLIIALAPVAQALFAEIINITESLKQKGVAAAPASPDDAQRLAAMISTHLNLTQIMATAAANHIKES